MLGLSKDKEYSLDDLIQETMRQIHELDNVAGRWVHPASQAYYLHLFSYVCSQSRIASRRKPWRAKHKWRPRGERYGARMPDSLNRAFSEWRSQESMAMATRINFWLSIYVCIFSEWRRAWRWRLGLIFDFLYMYACDWPWLKRKYQLSICIALCILLVNNVLKILLYTRNSSARTAVHANC